MALQLRFELLGVNRLTDKYSRLIERFSSSSRMRVFFEKSMVIMSASINKNFRSQGRPRGWEPLKPATLRRRRGGGKGGKILLDTGRLRAASTQFHERGANTIAKIGKGFAVFGSNLAYAGTHHFGNSKRNIPRRPFMFFQKQDVKDINRTLLVDVRLFDARNRIRTR